jgi:chromosome segregation ATPase
MSDDKELIAMARLAQRDERMSTGALYGDLADRIEALTARIRLVEASARLRAAQASDCIETLTAEVAEARAYAKYLAETMAAKGYPDVQQWEPLDDLVGLLTQIDNMVAGIRDRAEKAEQLVATLEAERDALEAKLAKAVEALEFYSPKTIDGVAYFGGDDAGYHAAATLAELKSQGDGFASQKGEKHV